MQGDRAAADAESALDAGTCCVGTSPHGYPARCYVPSVLDSHRAEPAVEAIGGETDRDEHEDGKQQSKERNPLRQCRKYFVFRDKRDMLLLL